MTQRTHEDASVMDTIREVMNDASSDRVFGVPVTQGGLTVIPVAKVSGGGGGGSGTEAAPDGTGGHSIGGHGMGGHGTGGGIGVSAKPLGVYVIRDGDVSWRPAVDVNRVIIGGQIVAVVALLTIRALIRARSRSVES